jgi:hypothetical protein
VTTFFLRSIELRNYDKKHLCSVVSVVDENKLLVTVSPAVPAHIYEQSEDLEMLVLAPRYADISLAPISEWPCVVNICIPNSAGSWVGGPWRLLDIGEISQANM